MFADFLRKTGQLTTVVILSFLCSTEYSRHSTPLTNVNFITYFSSFIVLNSWLLVVECWYVSWNSSKLSCCRLHWYHRVTLRLSVYKVRSLSVDEYFFREYSLRIDSAIPLAREIKSKTCSIFFVPYKYIRDLVYIHYKFVKEIIVLPYRRNGRNTITILEINHRFLERYFTTCLYRYSAVFTYEPCTLASFFVLPT